MKVNVDQINVPNVANSRELVKFLRLELSSGKYESGKRLPTIQDLAQRTGLAYGTVSRAIKHLSDEGLVRARPGAGIFLQGSGDENSRSDSSLRKHTSSVGLILPSIRTAYYPSIIHYLDIALRGHHLKRIVYNSNNAVESQAEAILQLLDQKATGVVLAPTTRFNTPAHHVTQLQKQNIPVVLLGRSVDGASAPTIKFPFEKIGACAARHFLNKGHTNVAFVSKDECIVTRMYLESLAVVMSEHNYPMADHFVHHGCWANVDNPPPEHLESIRLVLDRWMHLPGRQRPTAIFSSYDPNAELIYHELLKMGVNIPADFSLLGFGGYWRSNAILKELSSIVIDEETIADLAWKLIEEMLSGERPLDDDSVFELDLNLYEGTTLGPVPQTV